MGFRNAIVAGATLIREAIQSQNFATGVSGWQINQDGSAEFNNVVIRGGTVVSGLALYYSGPPAAGNLILSIAAGAGTDAYGNAYPQGFSVYGADGQLVADGSTLWVTGSNGSQVALSTGGVGQANVLLTPRDLVGTTWLDGEVATELAAADRPSVVVQSPSTTVNTAQSQITLVGGGPTTTDTYILVATDRVSVNNDLQVFGEITDYSSWTPFVTTVTNGGTAAYVGTNGYWKRIGDEIFVNIMVVVSAAGSGALAVAITMPTSIDRTCRQSIPGHWDGITAALRGTGAALAFAGGSGATIDRLRTSTNQNITGADLLVGSTLVIQGSYREA